MNEEIDLYSINVPKKVETVQISENECNFIFTPLENGFGITVGNALRRVLLSYIRGYAIYAIEIPGVKHEFSTIDGVVEDVVDIVLNLKKLNFKKVGELEEEVISVSLNSNVFKSDDINNFSENFKVVNEGFEICHFSGNKHFEIKLYINGGRGFEIAKKFDNSKDPIGKIYIDSIYSPVVNVAYKIDDVRIGEKIDYNCLNLTVETDGTITPQRAVNVAADILMDHFRIFSSNKTVVKQVEEENVLTLDISSMKIKKLLIEAVENLDFSKRPINCLQCAGIYYVKDLVVLSREQLLGIKNLGRKSIVEIDEFMEKNGLTFGMDISKYEL